LAHVSKGLKSLIRPSGGKDIAKTKGVHREVESEKSAEAIVPLWLQTQWKGLNFWTDNLLELILCKDNPNLAYKRVKSNKGGLEFQQ